ncbi:unnamed protein product [Chondrus crispus]|uniref:Uncharacterized protein n=1 Tax=Chondrus crispus TaxID=2769 RepID=R7QN15_CHOCR|nr:unnamed protein product [Chondrus crispus]CDF39897.1 unnamed protein product [Chondrus crispus]|eukprot:XP_005710191.1 unnamed protein product [Chondrus crispus]
MSVEIDDKEIAMAVLNGLPPRFDNLIVALDALGNEDKVFGLDFVKSRLLQEEQRESMKTASTTSPHAPALVNRMPIRRDMRCTNCNRHGHTAARCWGKDVNGRRPAPPDGFRSRNPGMKPSAFKAVNAGSWLVDSGCSAHITFDRSLFVTYEQMQSGAVEMGTKARANVAGRGEVEFMLNVNGSPHPCKLSNVLHVPDFGYSLLSVSQMTLHERMAHVNVQGIASMIHNNVVSGINRSSSRAQNCLDLVHSDVCGPLEVQSIGGSRYFITFVDDHSNWVVHQLTTAYTPEQNGVAERLNRTLIDLVRSMLSHKQVINTTPHHIWMKSTPNVGHLRVFGSKCWYTLPKLELRKLDLRAREAMFLGYSQCSKAYKLWDGELSKVVVSRDAKFDESTCGMHDIPAHEKDSISSDVGVVLLGGDNENEADTPNTNEVGSEEDEISGEVIENEDTHSVAAPLSHAHVAIEGPKTFKQATHGPRAAFWQTGIDKELASQTKNQTWKLQVQGLDYTETYAPVIKFTTIRLLLALVAHYDLELHQMDVVTAFLNGDLDEDIYMEQPEGCVDKSKSDHVCKLLKALYGLKQAHRQWHTKVDDFLLGELGFETSRSDLCLYIKRIGNTIMLIALYVDDLLLAGSDIHAMKWMKGELNKRFEMKDLSEAKVCIGLEIQRDRTIKTLSLTQTKYALNVLDRFKMSTCNPSLTPMEQGRKTTNSIENDSETKAPYREAVGCLMNLMVGTRPDLAYAIGKLSQHSANPCESHWAGVKRVMRYVQGTRNLGIVFDNKSKSPNLLGFSDADWAGSISWSSRKQTVVATLTCEAEYIALCEACKEATWLRQVVADVLGLDSDPTIMMGCDNAGTISFAQNESINRRNKHVDVKYHYVRDAIKRNIVYLSHCPTTSMPADILTKALGRILFQKFVELLGLAVSSKSM